MMRENEYSQIGDTLQETLDFYLHAKNNNLPLKKIEAGIAAHIQMIKGNWILLAGYDKTYAKKDPVSLDVLEYFLNVKIRGGNERFENLICNIIDNDGKIYDFDGNIVYNLLTTPRKRKIFNMVLEYGKFLGNRMCKEKNMSIWHKLLCML